MPGSKNFVEGWERGVVEADNRTDGRGRFVNLGLSAQLIPSRAEVLHLGKEVVSDLLVVT